MPAAQNRDVTADAPPVRGRPFEPGNNANPGGRPKGIARRAREFAGNDGELLLQFWVTAMSGSLPRQVVHPDGTTSTVIDEVSVGDRIACSRLIAERAYGKPPSFAPIEDDDPLDLEQANLEDLAAELDANLDELSARRKRQTPKPPAKRTRKAS